METVEWMSHDKIEYKHPEKTDQPYREVRHECCKNIMEPRKTLNRGQPPLDFLKADVVM
jgi:hypothetical protein